MQTQPTSVLRESLRNYALALLIFAVAMGARYVLDFVVPERQPFITFFPAVLVAAYFCSVGPSILVLKPIFAEAVHGLKGLPYVTDIRTIGLAARIDLSPIDGAPGLRSAPPSMAPSLTRIW